jgi:hypothetical protein
MLNSKKPAQTSTDTPSDAPQESWLLEKGRQRSIRLRPKEFPSDDGYESDAEVG